MRLSIVLLMGVVAVIGCASIGRRPAEARIHGSLCFAAPNSLVFPLGEDTTNGSDSSGAWLVLTPRSTKSGLDSWGRALAYDVYGNQQEGSWRESRDTLLVSTHDLFTINSLLLHRRDSLVIGQGSGTTDELIRNDSTGVFEPASATWHARFFTVNCRSLPGIPNR